MRTIENIRTFRAGRFTVRVDAIEDEGYDYSHMDAETEADVIEGVKSGRYMIFAVRAVCEYDGQELADDFLGGCIYANPREFMDHFGTRAASRKASAEAGRPICCGSYFSDMVHNVCAEARENLRKLAAVRVRA